MTDYADLEIGLNRRDAGSYTVDFRFIQPASETDVQFSQGQPAQATFDLEELTQLSYDPVAYGQKLTEFLFADPAVRSAFAQVRAVTESLHLALRLRLLIGPSAPELHNLYWETLRDPEEGGQLATSETILFSRYLSSVDWRPVLLRAKGDLSALVMVANPADLANYNLAPIDVKAEIQRARQGLVQIEAVALAEPGSGQRATLNNLFASLRETEFDILYLVCHGALIKEEPWLWLEDDQGQVARTSGTELVTRMKELAQRPRLVALVSCESAGSSTGDALAALGPRLARAGIPAVLAMQGKISMATVAEFMPVFFSEIQRDGQIDRAAAVARGAVRHRPDYWMPALFMRLKSGRIWYIPGFGDEESEFEKWQSLAGFIRDKTCTPILGPGLFDSMLGSQREIALHWADKHGFPLAPQDKEFLPRVAQYIITRQSPAYLPVALREAVRDEILRRYGDDLPEELCQRTSWTYPELVQAMGIASNKFWAKHPESPYPALAKLRLPLYITTGPLDLMTNALVEAGVQPEVRICPWTKWIPKEKVLFEEVPTPERPLVYHLFGHLSVPNSLVFAEDRYFDYLIGVTLNKSLIPSVVRAALSSTSLLFLGFQMDDWEFRVFFRFLMAQEGRELLKFYSHAAVQIEPEEDRILDIKRTRRYLEEYFESENIGIYWGRSEDFLETLRSHL